MEHIKSQNEGLFTTEERHEGSDVNVKLIGAFGVFLIVLAIVVHVVLAGFYKFLDYHYESNQAPDNPMTQVAGSAPGVGQPKNPVNEQSETGEQATRRLVATFPEPRLQPDEYRDYEIYRKKMQEQTTGYSWISQQSGSVRIPIARAMEIVAERGLPAVAPSVAGASASAAGQPAQQKPPSEQKQ
jgi:hypothetical protein